jgi:hypothetical protein
VDAEERREDHLKWRTEMEKQIKENTAVTKETREKVDEVYAILAAARGAFKFFGLIGVFAKWVGICVAAVSAVLVLIYQLTHGGELPPK